MFGIDLVNLHRAPRLEELSVFCALLTMAMACLPGSVFLLVVMTRVGRLDERASGPPVQWGWVIVYTLTLGLASVVGWAEWQILPGVVDSWLSSAAPGMGKKLLSHGFLAVWSVLAVFMTLRHIWVHAAELSGRPRDAAAAMHAKPPPSPGSLR